MRVWNWFGLFVLFGLFTCLAHYIISTRYTKWYTHTINKKKTLVVYLSLFRKLGEYWINVLYNFRFWNIHTSSRFNYLLICTEEKIIKFFFLKIIVRKDYNELTVIFIHRRNIPWKNHIKYNQYKNCWFNDQNGLVYHKTIII